MKSLAKSEIRVIAFDLDEVLCYRPKNVEHLGIDKYKHCKPKKKMISIVNKLWRAGHYIKIFTARGMSFCHGDLSKVHNSLYALTTDQLVKWGVEYNELVMGKTHYDLLIDDRAMDSATVKGIDDILRKI